MEIITAIWELVVSGAPNALNAVLLGTVFYLLWEKREVRKIIDEQNKTINTIHTEYVESITKMIDRYHQGNLDLISMLKEIRVVLSTMQKHI